MTETPTTDAATDARLERFRAEMADLRLKAPNPGRDALMASFGAALLVVGLVVGVIAFAMSHGTDSSLQQRDAIVVVVLGLSLTVAGGVLFLRYSFSQFLRFWLARILFEKQQQAGG